MYIVEIKDKDGDWKKVAHSEIYMHADVIAFMLAKDHDSVRIVEEK